jgi:Lipoxygenase
MSDGLVGPLAVDGVALTNPSRHVPPHQASADRRRARQATLRLLRQDYAWARDSVPGDPDGEPVRALPPFVARLTPDEDFPPSKKAWLLLDKSRMSLNGSLTRLASFGGIRSERRYRKLFRLVGLPPYAPSRWRDDAEFARQRLTGVNPMRLRLAERLDAELTRAVDDGLSHAGHAGRTGDLLRDARLFETTYFELAHQRVQRNVHRGKHLAAPHCLFWVDDHARLMPLAIRLRPGGPVFTPRSPHTTWLLARMHAQAADGCVHEGIHHLLETHLVNEAVAICLNRWIHPDHPIQQLLGPHYQGNLAINHIARHDLLAPGGPIDLTMAAGVAGTMEAARIYYKSWRFDAASLDQDLAARGLFDVPDFYYRDDARPIEQAIRNLVTAVLAVWYRSDEDVVLDDELQAFCAEAADPAGGDIPGFPPRLKDRAGLIELVTHLMFRAGPQHAAVNNGQFDTYGWIPNTPGSLTAALPEDPTAEVAERALWKAMPGRAAALAQMGMVWVLSRPTRRSLLHAGEAAAFDPALCLQATEAVAAFQRRLQQISDQIQLRNETLDVPYRYLDPTNISRSTDI